MKVYLDPQTLFTGGRSNNTDANAAVVKILEKALKQANRKLEEAGKKKPDEKKKEDDKEKFSAGDWFLTICGISGVLIVVEAWIILQAVSHLVEVLHK